MQLKKPGRNGKKALVFWPYNPFPPITGTHQIQLSDVKALRELGHEITVFGSACATDSSGSRWDDSAVRSLRSKLGVEVRLHEFSSIEKLYMHRQYTARPEGWEQCTTPWYEREFHRLFHELRPDLVLIHYPRWAKLAMSDELDSAIRVVRTVDQLALNECMIRFVAPLLPPHVAPSRLDPKVLEEDFFSRQNFDVKDLESHEFMTYDSFDITASLAPHDTEVISANTSRTGVHHIPPAFPVVPLNNSYDAGPLLVISNYPLNVQGYYYFARRVLPQVLRRVPNFSLQVAGKACRNVTPGPGIKLLHYVPDLKPLYAGAKFAICPVIGGTGMQIKIVEAMAHGVPAIALGDIAKNSPIEDGVNGLVARNAEEFAEHAVRLSLDKDLCRKLGEAARNTIRDRYSPEALAGRWAKAIADAKRKRHDGPAKGGISNNVISVSVQEIKKNSEKHDTVTAACSKSPKISIITPSYNCAAFIRACIESVIAQGYENFEHIVVDGASKDGTVEILKEYPHIRWISEPDDGESHALNKALRRVTGDIVCWLNADDWHRPGVFKRVVEEFQKNPGPCVVYGNTDMVDEAGKFLVLKKSAPDITLEFLTKWWRCPAQPHQPSMFFSKAVIDDAGPFRQDLHFSVDYEYWLRIIGKYPFRYVDMTFSAARMRVDSKGLDTEAGQIESHWKVSLPYHDRLSSKEREAFWTEYYLHRLFERKDPEPTRIPESSEACIGLSLALLRAGKIKEAFCDLFPDAEEQESARKSLFRFAPKSGDAPRAEVERVRAELGAGPSVSGLVKKVPVLWSAPVFDPSGYADQARNFIKRIGADWPLYLRPAGNFDDGFVSGMDQSEYKNLADRAKNPGSPYISILSMPAYAFQRDPNALYNVGKTYFETDRLSPDWVSRCNAMDEVWVSTAFNARTFHQSGVKVPIVVVPDGVDTDAYRPGLEPLPIPGRRGFAFLSIFEWTYRKGWDLLLRAWAEAFSPADDVCLILRSYPVRGDKNPHQDIEARVKAFHETIGRSLDDVAPIIILKEQVPQRLMPNLYAAADAFVLPSRGEGWGKPYIEAMSCGLPVIGTGWGGSTEFMNGDNSYLIETTGLEPVDEKMELPFYRGHLWSSPSPDHLKALMKEVFLNPEAAGAKGQKARREVIARWTWKHSAGLALARVKEISSGLGKTISVPENGKSKPSSPAALCVRWEGLQFAWHSLALINREMCLRLIDRGHEVSILRYLPEEFGTEKDPRFVKLAERVRAPLSRQADIHIRHHYPPDFNPPPEGRLIIMQPWEYGTIPEEWVEPMATMADQIWVPTKYVLKSFISSGVPSDLVRIVPYGVNTDIFAPGAKPFRLPTEKKYKFLFVGGTIWRKGLDILLQAYRSAFSKKDDVVLVIKEIGQANYYKGIGSDNLIAEFANDPAAPDILHMTEMLDEGQMAGLFNACDCLVHSYRGEGFGLPVLEAMSCGLPVIVTAGGSTDDFCSSETACLIPSASKGFHSTRMKFAGGGPGWVLEPDPEALTNLLRYAFENPDKMKENAGRALAHARNEFCWDNVAAKVIDGMRQLMRKPVRRRA